MKARTKNIQRRIASECAIARALANMRRGEERNPTPNKKLSAEAADSRQARAAGKLPAAGRTKNFSDSRGANR